MSAKTTQIRSLFLALLVLGAVPALLVLGMYVWHFASLSGYALSNEHSAWADFGSYVGGLLGVWFAFLAFVGVLLAVRLQKKQLKHAHVQGRLDELQRVISNVASNIDSELNIVPSAISRHERYDGQRLTVWDLISVGGREALQLNDGGKSKKNSKDLLAFNKEALSEHVGVLGIELDQLVWCLQKYEAETGSPVINEFYHRRYRSIVCWLDAMGYFSGFVRIQKFFRPSELREFLKPSINPDEQTQPGP